jgi:oxygen-independent coproporphyrinogen-3 oxidase
MNDSDLIKKYDVQVPRYTSYPTVPYWSDSPTREQWLESLARAFGNRETSWSLYMHLPFCETLCTFCGCNTVITRNHDKEQPYIRTLLRELELYLAAVPELANRPLRQLHLGGGTPTFMSAAHLRELIENVYGKLNVAREGFEGSVEVDPRRTNPEQLRVLFDLGFTRVSMGVQDFDSEVQRLVNRIQPFEMTRDLTAAARKIGYTSVNFDLIYGLPKQTPDSFAPSVERTIQLRPDRIALYSFAKVPWIKPQQRLFKDSDLPVGGEKRALYELAYRRLAEAGYLEIGMDHFALPDDALAKAWREKTMHRNFMGYTETRTDVLLALGVSGISETPDCFHQNQKVLPVYEREVHGGAVPTLRGHMLNAEDRAQRARLLQMMCQGEVRLDRAEEVADVRDFLRDMFTDGLVQLDGGVLRLTEKGRPFLRNACVVFDLRLRRQKPETRVFSAAL